MLKEFIPNFVNAPSQREYKLAALELIARIHDTHANIWSEDMTPGKKFSAVEITFIENKAVVTGFLDEKTSELSGLKKGDIIESINKKSVEDIVKEKLSLTPASNYETQLRDIGLRLLKTDDENLSVTYSRAGFSSTISLATYPPGNINVFKKFNRTDTCFRMISPEIAYFFGGNSEKQISPNAFFLNRGYKRPHYRFQIIPIRFLVFSLNEFLMPTSTPFARFSAPSITSPGQFIMKPPIEAGKNNPDYYKGKVVILINELTQSSAEYHTMAFRASPNATVIGSKTAGADGNVSTIMLPGGIRTMISGIGVYYPDGRETQRIGIVPDIEVKPTIKGITEGRDEVLEKAIELINKK
ncbi:MAG: S41 family peptidase [Bacteroidota bacterium]